MKINLQILSLALILASTSASYSQRMTGFSNVSSINNTDLFFIDQFPGSVETTYNVTALQLHNYITGGGSLAITSGKTLTDSNTLTFTGVDSSTVAFGSGGTVLYTAGIGSTIEAWSAKLDKLAALSAPSSSEVLWSDASGNLSWNQPILSVIASGTNTYTATPSPVVTAYQTGLYLIVKFTNANTGGASLNLNSLGAIPIQQAGAAITAGTIPAGGTIALLYDGANFQIVEAPVNVPNVTLFGNTVGYTGMLQPYTVPTGSIIVVLGDSVQAGGGGGTEPSEFLSGMIPNTPVYDFAIGSTTSGPNSSYATSGLGVMATGAGYREYENGSLLTTGSGTPQSLYATVTGNGNLYFIAAYGINDLFGVNGMTLTSYESSMASIWSTAHGWGGNVKVIVPTITNCTTIPSSQMADWNGWLLAQLSSIQGTGGAYPDYLADENSFFSNLSAGTFSGNPWSTDGVHPTVIGEKMNAAVIADTILRQVTAPHTLGASPDGLPIIAGYGNTGLAGSSGGIMGTPGMTQPSSWRGGQSGSGGTTGNGGNGGNGGFVNTFGGNGSDASGTTNGAAGGAGGDIQLQGANAVGTTAGGAGGVWTANADGANPGGGIDLNATSGASGGSLILSGSTVEITTPNGNVCIFPDNNGSLLLDDRSLMTSNATATVTFNTDDCNETVYNPSGSALAAVTITLPTNATRGMILRYTTSVVSTITMAGASVTGWQAPTATTAGSCIAFQCISNSGNFVRIQ